MAIADLSGNGVIKNMAEFNSYDSDIAKHADAHAQKLTMTGSALSPANVIPDEFSSVLIWNKGSNIMYACSDGNAATDADTPIGASAGMYLTLNTRTLSLLGTSGDVANIIPIVRMP